ncbi:MAG TPA: ABC transporter permease [Gemmatimonadales bacterium]|nr:ABC transporter permease [Gemmatimonadales bacterium]
MGSTTAIFSVVDAVLLRPLPYKDPERIVRVFETSRGSGRVGAIAPANFLDWESRQDSFSALAAWRNIYANLSSGAQPERVSGVMATSSLFPVLGLTPVLGRTFGPENEQPGSEHVVVLGDGLWKRRFGSDPRIVGSSVRLNNESYTILGVLPTAPSFSAELWLPSPFRIPVHPLRPGEDPRPFRGSHYLEAVARLKPGVPISQALAQLDTISRELEAQFPASNSRRTAGVLSLHEDSVREARPTLVVLLGAAGSVLLIGCTNVANLLMARGAGRAREISIRAALGAGRLRLIRQLLTESALLALLGGVVGVLLSVWLTRLFLAAGPSDIRRFGDAAVDGRILAFALVVSLATGVLFGSAPALRGARVNLNDALKEGGRSAEGMGRRRMLALLVVGEIVLSFVLLVGAGLLMRSFMKLMDVDAGFTANNLLIFNISPPSTMPAARQTAIYDEIIARVREIPGVHAVGGVSRLPLSGGNSTRDVNIPGKTAEFSADIRVSTPDYFRAMGIPLRRGRDFTARDGAAASPVAIVNEALARQFFPGEDPIGKRLIEDKPREIVGVVGNVRHTGLEDAPRAELYVPLAQSTWFTLSVAVRTSDSDPLALVPAVQKAVWSVDREMPIAGLKTMEEAVAGSVLRRRFSMILVSIFAGAAMLLAAIGLYGVVSFSVAQRTREFGIRMALGARPGDLLGSVLAHGVRLTLAGLAVGLLLAAAVTRLISNLLYGVAPGDPWTFGAVCLLFAVIALLACFIPARRASRVDPMVALRDQ